MSMNFADALKDDKKWTETENGAVAKNTTDHPLLDLFATIGSLRQRTEDEIIKKFRLAYHEDKQGALRCLFYARDIRGGLGERNTFRVIYKYLGNSDPEFVEKYLYLIPEMGRYDDFYALINTKAEEAMWKYVLEQLQLDKKSMEQEKPCSLLAKWLKKADSSSKDTKMLGIYTAKKLGMSVYDYKRLCNKLRRYIDVTEVKMSENDWCKIEYAKVPSKAMLNYRAAFERHDETRYQEYIDKVNSGEEKINASTLYPYDIVLKCFYGDEHSKTLDALWNNLPNYVEPGQNFLVLADVSGSMSVNNNHPLASSIGLAIYFAERNKGKFHNLFMTFSMNPEIVSIPETYDDSIVDKIDYVRLAEWGYNTNLTAAFEKILSVAIEYEIPVEEMPKALIVISDMEIDEAAGQSRETYATYMSRKFEENGYELPKLVFWNVNSRNDTFLADANDTNTILVSGSSTSTFKNLIGCLNKTPIEMMYEVLNSDRYATIVVVED